MSCVAGIDISKRYLDCCIPACSQEFRVGNDSSGLAQLVTRLLEAGVERVLIEATGGYEKRLREALVQTGVETICINPARARRYAEAIGMEVKTDKIDARVLADFAATLKACKSTPFSLERDEMSELVKQRDCFVQQRDDEKRRRKQAELAAVIESYQAHIDFLNTQIRALDKAIAQAMKALNDLMARRLMAVKGIGLITTANLLCYLPELGTLTKRQVARLAGLAPLNRDSGDSVKPRHIKGGRWRVRRAVYMSTWVIIRHDAGFRAKYDDLRQRGKAAKVAIVACMRVLITRLNAMLRDGTEWRSEPR
jgi:transposase